MPAKAMLPAPASDPTLLPHLLSVAKSVRQLVALKLAAVDVAVGQDVFLLSFETNRPTPVLMVAKALSVRPATASKMIDILERKGWVVRSADPVDGRRVLVRLTDDGQVVADAVRDVHAELEVELRKALVAENGMASILSRIDGVLSRRLSRLR